jgi:hypothetical protein
MTDEDRIIPTICFGAAVGLVLSLWFLVAYYGAGGNDVTNHISDRPDMFADFRDD